MQNYIPSGFRNPLTKQWRKPSNLFNPALLTWLLFSFIFSTKAIGQAANIDQGQNGSATSRTSPVKWINGNLGPSGAHFAEGYSIPYRMSVSALVGTSSTVHHLIIEWDTKDQNGHALDYITYFDNLDNPSGSHQANFGHVKEDVIPTAGTAFSGAPTLYPIPRPLSTGAEVPDMPGLSFDALPTASRTNNASATMMAIWGGTITAITYGPQDQQDATTASTKSSVDISFTAADGKTALLAWGGHIAAEYDWGTGRGASKVNGSPYHMRLISIDGKGGNQDRSLKASAVLVPTVGCTITPNTQSACEGSTAGLVYNAAAQSGVTNYSWTLTAGTTNAIISGTAAGVNTVSGASFTSVTIVPASGGFTTGTFSLSLTLTNLGGAGTPCTATGTINPAATANAGGPYAMCSSDATITLVGKYGGGATGGTWTGGTAANYGTPVNDPNAKTVTVVYTPTAAEKTKGSVDFTFTTTGQSATCIAAYQNATATINTIAAAFIAIIQPPTCSSATGTLKAQVDATTNYTPLADYQFSNNGGSTWQDSPEFSFVAGAGYNITVRNRATGCVATATCTGQAKIAVTQQRLSTSTQLIELSPEPKVTAAPNPFNDQVRFSVKSAVSGQGSLELYNMLGQKVKTVFQGRVEAGQIQNFEYNVPNAQRSNMVYIFRVGDQKVTGKLIGIK